MKPIYPYVAVERTENENSSLIQTVEHRPVVKVIATPLVPPEETETVEVGQKILANHVEEYLIDGTKYFFVHSKDIICIM